MKSLWFLILFQTISKTAFGASALNYIKRNNNERLQDSVTRRLSTEFPTVAVELSSDGTTVTTDIGRDIFNEDFAACPIVQYIRNNAIVAVYKRLTMLPSSFDAYEIFTGTWSSTPDNNLNSDFEIYDDYSEMLASGARWNYCNYDYTNIGFPLHCGKDGTVVGRWFAVSLRIPINRY
jgi:hypothetical protein